MEANDINTFLNASVSRIEHGGGGGRGERRRDDVTGKNIRCSFFFSLPRGIVSTGKVVYIYPRGKMTFIGEAESHQAHNIAAYRSKRSAIDARTIRFGPERYNR